MSIFAGSKVLVCLTLQAEGCTLELWNTHKNLLKKNFGQLVNEVRAQRRGQQETRHQGDQRHAETSTTAANAPRPVLRPIGAITGSIQSELDLPRTTSISDTISMSMSLLGLAAVGTMTLKDKAAQVAHELGIPITEESQGFV